MQQNQQGQLVILHFNDAYDIQRDPKGDLGFINFYDHLLKMRKAYPKCLLVFSGDAFAPSKLSRVLQGWQMVECLKMLKIDVACYGNHDFDYHPDHALKLAKACKIPWLMGNIKDPQTNQNIGEGLDYYIIQAEGIKIGFMGLAGPDFKGRLISDYKNLKYINAVEHAKAICKVLRQKNCSLIIALNHMRMPADKELANKVSQIDIILGGHDHSNIYEIVNQIPIIKSGSNFEFMSVVKIFRGDIKAGRQKNVRFGRRWNFQVQCKKVKKSTNFYPEIQEYIDQCAAKYRTYDKSKSIASNKPKKQAPQIPKNKWIFKYQLINNRPTISITAGLSAEVCFAKYVAFKRGYFYSGYQKSAPTLSINYIEIALKAIEEEILSHKDNGKTILYSPGICNAPYLIETGNFVYLPSQLLVGVHSISDLEEMLKYSLEKGYKCYAVLGYDPFISDKLCAWIKFCEPPQQYINIAHQLKIQNIIFMSVHDVLGQNHGDERLARLISSSSQQQKREYPQAGDIYIMFVEESYLNNNSKDILIFEKLIKDRTSQQWKQVSKKPACLFIHDWQSGIDCVKQLQKMFKIALNQQKLQCYYILDRDSWNLYVTSYHLGKKFIEKNYNQEKRPEKFNGVVFNQYIMSNPTYQLNYGYIPVLYWQLYPHNQERILKLLTQQQKKLKRWLNMHKGTKIGLINHSSFKILTDHEGIQLVKWTTKHAPTIYEQTFLELNQVLSTLTQLQLLYSLQGQSFKKIQ